VQLGPEYSSLVASSQAQQNWTSSWVDHYQKAGDLETLRRVNEEYLAKILDYGPRDLARIQKIICYAHSPAWPVNQGDTRPKIPYSEYVSEYDKIWPSTDVEKWEPRVCLGTDHLMGIVPSAARPGDVVVRFWNCSAAVVMRPIKTSTNDRETPCFIMVGRADVAEVLDRKDKPGCDSYAEKRLSDDAAYGLGPASQHSGAVYVDMNWKTLQAITAYIGT